MDNGDAFNPDSHTRPALLPLDLWSTESQRFLKGVCEDVRAAPWFDQSETSGYDNCTIEAVMLYMEVS